MEAAVTELNQNRDDSREQRTQAWVLDAGGVRPASPTPGPGRPAVASRPPRWPWLAAALDVLLLSSAPGVEAALDGHPLLASLLTLGGRAWLVQLLATASLLLLVVLAPLTNGFRDFAPAGRALLVMAGMLTLVAGAGLGLGLLVLPGLLLALVLIKLLKP